MARSSECTEQYAQKVLDTAGIVRDACFQQLSRRLSQHGFPRYGITAGLPVIRPKCGLTKSVESAIAY